MNRNLVLNYPLFPTALKHSLDMTTMNATGAYVELKAHLYLDSSAA